MGFDLYMFQEPRYQAAISHFQTGARGMAMLTDVMEESGVIDPVRYLDTPIDAPWPPPGMEELRAEYILGYMDGEGDAPHPPPSEAEQAACRQYKAVRDAWLATRSAQPGKVPAFKFSNNGGWIVTPEECDIIATALEKLLADLDEDGAIALARRIEWDPDDVDTLIDWLEDRKDYNRVAATHGGYAVC